jgi:alkyldihydroxyacetonephosphate synthase
MRAFDPARILNPGNLLPPEGPAAPAPSPAYPAGDAQGVAIDEVSQLACIPGTMTLASAEQRLRAGGLTLGLDGADTSMTLAGWLATGAPGARDRWLDPVDQLFAGFDATLPDGQRLSIRPAPRRAVGPDLAALFLGTHGRFGSLDRAWMRVHRAGVARATSAAFARDRDPPVSAGERALLEAISREATPSADRP